MKSTNPSKWYQLAKRLGTDDHKNYDLKVECLNDDLKVECLNDVPLNEAAEEIAKHFSHISQEYLPLDLKQLPSYLPAQNTLKVSQVDVADKLWKMKSRRSIDL